MAGVVLVGLLAACGGEGGSGGPEDSANGASRAPDPDRDATDPDDINGDGHWDLVLTVPVAKPGSQGTETRIAVVPGSASGLAPARRTLYSRLDLGLPSQRPVNRSDTATTTRGLPLTIADLNADGYADFVTQVLVRLTDAEARRVGSFMGVRPTAYVTWGGPSGPPRGAEAVRLKLPGKAGEQGLEIVRGDFDGDGHQDLAGPRQDGRAVKLLYGPFTRKGAPARVGSRPMPKKSSPVYESSGEVVADDLATSGRPHVTGLFLHMGSDGEQSDGLLFAAGKGKIADKARTVRAGNAYAFGDFDGNGTRDFAVGDDGSRNDEPGYETEPAEIDGSYAVYSGKGGAPHSYRLPKWGRQKFFAVDPDGDGEDGLLVAGADIGRDIVLIEGEREVANLSRSGPDSVDGRPVAEDDRQTQVDSVADSDVRRGPGVLLHPQVRVHRSLRRT